MTGEDQHATTGSRWRIRLRRARDGWRIDVGVTVDASADHAWTLLTDTEAWPHWGPSVTGVTLDGDTSVIGPGSRGRVTTPVGLRLPFRIDECRPYRWTWRVAGVRATGHRVEPIAVDRCRVVFEVPLWAPFYVPVVWLALRRITRLLADDHPP